MRKNQRPQATCHPKRLHKALGLCGPCYDSDLYRRQGKAQQRLRRNYRGKARGCESYKKLGLSDIERKRIKLDLRLQKTYGISLAQYEEMLASQNDGCAICGYVPKPGKRRLAVDHCHKTKQVRGLLCMRCNRGLAWFGDQPKRLLAASRYLMS